MPRIRAENIEAHKAQTRSDIVDAAQVLIAEIGSADISLAEVAHEAGIGRTTLYEYFRDKDDLIASLVEERLPDVIDDVVASIADGDPVEERLSKLAEATVEFVVTDRVLGLILHRELSRLSANAQDRIRMSHSDLAGAMMGIYFEGVASGIFRRMAPDIAGRFVNELIMAAAKVLIAAPDPGARFPEVASELRAFLLGGLRA
ncbi:MAG TPA: TetR/AcrR family transcriptional regulator [Acidimicrobiia bacterium]